MKIILLTDGSPLSLEAAHWLAGHAGGFAAPVDIHVFHVHHPLPYPGVTAVTGRAAVESFYRETSEEALAGATAILERANIPFHVSWAVGDVAATIAEYARFGRFDLVVLGTHGRGALLNLALGSVATRCMAVLDIPVLAVPTRR